MRFLSFQLSGLPLPLQAGFGATEYIPCRIFAAFARTTGVGNTVGNSYNQFVMPGPGVPSCCLF
jgi:hypothetical protein